MTERNSAKNARTILSRFFSGELPGWLQEMIVEWYGESAETPATDEALNEVFGKFVTPDRDPSPEVFEKLAEIKKRLGMPEPDVRRIRESLRPQRGKRRPLYRSLAWKVAAILLPFLILGGAVYFALNRQGELPPDMSVPALISHSTDAGEQLRIVLPDGSTVKLSGTSTLAYAADFTENRRVTLTGEALFSVEKDPAHPFRVQADGVTVTVTGTEFLVRAFGDETGTEVVLASGSVAVGTADRTTELVPMESLVYDRSTGSVDVRPVSGEEMLNLTGEALDFRNTPLEDVFRQVGRNYRIDVRIDRRVSLDRGITANFDKSEPMEKVVSILQIATPDLDYIIEGNTVTVSPR